jgi:hypothetical protein
MYGGMEIWLHIFLTLALDGGEKLHTPAALIGRKNPWVPIG